MSPKSNDSPWQLARLANPLVLIAGIALMGWCEVKLTASREELWSRTSEEEWVGRYNAVSTRPVESIWGLTEEERLRALDVLAQAERQRTTGIVWKLYGLVLLEGAGAGLSLTVVARFLLRRPAPSDEPETPNVVLKSAEGVPGAPTAAPETTPVPT
jgi:hypothetical protein